MNSNWPQVPLGDVLRKAETWVNLSPEETYKEVTVRLWGRGVVLRREATGAESGASRRLRVEQGQFIFSRIDARNGAFGIVPPELDGAVVSNDFPVFDVDSSRLLPDFLGWLSRTVGFVETCKAASEGTTNRVRLKKERFLRVQIAVPPLAEQHRIVERIERLAAMVGEARRLAKSASTDCANLLQSAFRRIATGSPTLPMATVAPIVRRAITIRADQEYPELGIRSFGKGTFHKPPLQGIAVGEKRLFRIEPDDLIFNNVFAWEGAVAVAEGADAGRFGSHRFITCVPDPHVATSRFLRFFFLTHSGLALLDAASPGGAGRNRTLGVAALAAILVPVPPVGRQRWFDNLQAAAEEMVTRRKEAVAELDVTVPAFLRHVFGGTT